jgi:hypothetical protein
MLVSWLERGRVEGGGGIHFVVVIVLRVGVHLILTCFACVNVTPCDSILRIQTVRRTRTAAISSFLILT